MKILSTNFLNPKQYLNPNVLMSKTAQIQQVWNIIIWII